jgi:hypothetical protein
VRREKGKREAGEWASGRVGEWARGRVGEGARGCRASGGANGDRNDGRNDGRKMGSTDNAFDVRSCARTKLCPHEVVPARSCARTKLCTHEVVHARSCARARLHTHLSVVIKVREVEGRFLMLLEIGVPLGYTKHLLFRHVAILVVVALP